MTIHRTPIIALVVALALVVAACGDSGESSDDGASTTSSTEASSGDTPTSEPEASSTTVADDGTTTTAAPDTTQGTIPDVTDPDVQALLELYETTPVRATYIFNDSGDETVVTISQDPTADPPASAMIGDDFHMVTTSTEMLMCDPTAQSCFKIPIEAGTDNTAFLGAFLNPFLSGFLAFAGGDVPGFDIESDSVEIAGRQGVCYTASAQAFVGADVEGIRSCVDAELGVTLLVEVKDAGATDYERVMELIEIGEPQPEDFAPPYPVQDLPGVPEG